MTARDFLLRGLLAGFIAGILAFGVAHQVGEPQVDKAIALEEAGGAAHDHEDGHAHGGESVVLPAHGGDEGTTEVSRGTQSTWGLATGTLVVGTALGGLVALASAALAGRLGRLRAAASTAVVSLVGFVAVALVPFLKYPANPPAVGDPDTIGRRTALYFTFLLLSLVVAVVALVLTRTLLARTGGFEAGAAGVALYLVVMVAAAALMPTVNEVGDFPGDTLWAFRVASLLTLATTWAGIGAVLSYLVLRLDRQYVARQARRDLAASL